MNKEDKKLLSDTWKEVVDVQMHFNDLELRIRSFAFTVTAAFLALGGYALKDAGAVPLGGTQIPLASIVVFSAVFPVMAFYFMERWWYHPLLVGAVLEGAALETLLRHEGVPINLGNQISRESGISNWFIGQKKKFTQSEISSDPALSKGVPQPAAADFYVKRFKILFRRSFRSSHKMMVFYLMLALSLLIVAVALSFAPAGKPAQAGGGDQVSIVEGARQPDPQPERIDQKAADRDPAQPLKNDSVSENVSK